jgi:hypothetical protein
MTLIDRINNAIKNKDFSEFQELQLEVEVESARLATHGQKNYPEQLNAALFILNELKAEQIVQVAPVSYKY